MPIMTFSSVSNFGYRSLHCLWTAPYVDLHHQKVTSENLCRILCNIRSCLTGSSFKRVRYRGAIHKIRRIFFGHFWSPPSPISEFWPLFTKLLPPTILQHRNLRPPSLLKYADIFYGWHQGSARNKREMQGPKSRRQQPFNCICSSD